MDISIGSPSGLSGPFSPRTRTSLASKRSSLLSNFRGHGKFKSSGRLTQNATVIQKTLQNSIENFGLPLPVLVTETLTFADGNARISARLSPNGWGWVVCGRRLLVWPYREPRPSASRSTHTPTTPSHSTQHHTTPTCYELTLPQTDLAHKADLVCVYPTEGNQVPSCIGVSPEGMIRWWPSVGREGGYWDEEAELSGQECDTLMETISSPSSPHSCLLATTTCTVVLIQTTIAGGRHAVMAKTLSGSGGWFGGIGRRVSSLFFSAMPSSHSSETKLVGVAPLAASPYDDSLQSPGSPQQHSNGRVCVVAGLRAQLWKLSTPESIVSEADLQRVLRDAFLHSQSFPPGDPGLLDVSVLDIQSWNDGILMLVSAVNLMRSPQVKYALAHMSVEENTGGIGHLLGMVPLAASVECGPQGSVRLLATATHAYLIQKDKIIVVSCVTPNEKPDVIELHNSTNGDQILGSGLFCNTPLFFSKTHGVITVLNNDTALNDTSFLDSPMSSPHPSSAFDGQLSLYELDPRSVAATGAPAPEQLKAAFLHHVRKEHAASRQIISTLFPTQSTDSDEEETDIDSLIDRTLLTIATDLVNDIPANDPRWNQAPINNPGAALGSSGSLQITPQLQDKKRALSLLYEFCKTTGLWGRIGGVTPIKGGQPTPTVLLLRELAEKIAAAIALRTLQQQSQHQHVVDTAIQQVMANLSDEDEENILSSATLSPSDLFYKNVSGVQRALIQACRWCKQQDEAGCEPPALSQLISKVNQVLLTVIQEVLKHRTQFSEFYCVQPAVQRMRLEHTTWTSCPRSGSLLQALRAQQSLSIERAKRASPELKGELRSQAASLGSALLQMMLERAQGFSHGTKRRQVAMKDYHQMRTEIIQPFVEEDEYEEATILAEKYHDFDMLVQICEKSNNKDKLYHYMDKFEDMGFQEAAFKWFMNKGRGGQAALLRTFPHHAASLSRWLVKNHNPQSVSGSPPHLAETLLSEEELEEDAEQDAEKNLEEGNDLLWLHEMRNGRWLSAAATLIHLAQAEQESVHRMNVQASLAKLSALAAETGIPGDSLDELLTAADQRLLLKDYHNLPASLLAHHGLTQNTLRVMEPRDIVDMYITYEGDGLTEYDYVRALELCSLVIGEVTDVQAVRCEVAELRRRVWCATLLADQWLSKDAEEPMHTIQNKLFFKVVDAVHLLECSLEDYLIPLKDLLASPELSFLVADPAFQYIMMYGYDHVYKSQQTENMVVETSN